MVSRSLHCTKYPSTGPPCPFHLDLSQKSRLIVFSLYSGRHLYTPGDNKCYKHIYPDILCTQLQGVLPNAATLFADANVEGYRDANLLGSSEVFNYDIAWDSSVTNPTSPSLNSNPGSGNLFENSNRMQKIFISDASAVPPSQVAANNAVTADFGSLLGGTNSDFNIDDYVQEVGVPNDSDQTGVNSFGNISPPDQANNFLQYVPDFNV